MERSPLAGLDANLLVVVDALLSEQSVGGAAKRVGLSQSAVSHALGRARDVLDDELLVRAGRRMVLTPRGRSIAPKLREAMSLLAAAVDRAPALDLAAERRTLKIAATDYAHELVGVPLLALLARQTPLVDLVVHPFATSSLGDLARGDIDLAVAGYGSVRGLRHKSVSTEAFVCVVRRGHPALASRLTPARFAALGHVLISPRGRSRGAVDVALAKRRMRRRVVYVSPTFMAAAQVVAATDLVLTCGRRSAVRAAAWLGLEVFEPPLPIAPFSQAMFWHERQEHDAFLTWVRERVVELVAPT